MISPREFPNLTQQNHRVASPRSTDYNCIAWSAGDTEHWWQPGIYWPLDVSPYDCGIGDLAQAFRVLGYEDCDDETLASGVAKVALYGSGFLYSHAARQLPNGKWTSKLGKCEDIEHATPEDVAGGVYGEVMHFMKRPLRATTP